MSFGKSKSCVEVRLLTVNTSHCPIQWSKQWKVSARTCPHVLASSWKKITTPRCEGIGVVDEKIKKVDELSTQNS